MMWWIWCCALHREFIRVINMNVNRGDLGLDVSQGSCRMCYKSGTIFDSKVQIQKCMLSIAMVCSVLKYFKGI